MDSQKVSKGWKFKTKKWRWRPSPYATTTLISLHLWWFATHQRRIIISIYHSIDIWEEFSTTGVFSTENRSAYRRRWENYRWCDALIWIKNLKALYGLMSLVYCAVYTWIYINGLVDYIRMPILTRWSRLRHRVHYHPNAQQHSTMQQSTSYEKGLCRNQ